MMKRQSFLLTSLDDIGYVGMDKFAVRFADSKQIFVFDNYLPFTEVLCLRFFRPMLVAVRKNGRNRGLFQSISIVILHQKAWAL